MNSISTRHNRLEAGVSDTFSWQQTHGLDEDSQSRRREAGSAFARDAAQSKPRHPGFPDFDRFAWCERSSRRQVTAPQLSASQLMPARNRERLSHVGRGVRYRNKEDADELGTDTWQEHVDMHTSLQQRGVGLFVAAGPGLRPTKMAAGRPIGQGCLALPPPTEDAPPDATAAPPGSSQELEWREQIVKHSSGTSGGRWLATTTEGGNAWSPASPSPNRPSHFDNTFAKHDARLPVPPQLTAHALVLSESGTKRIRRLSNRSGGPAKAGNEDIDGVVGRSSHQERACGNPRCASHQQFPFGGFDRHATASGLPCNGAPSIAGAGATCRGSDGMHVAAEAPAIAAPLFRDVHRQSKCLSQEVDSAHVPAPLLAARAAQTSSPRMYRKRFFESVAAKRGGKRAVTGSALQKQAEFQAAPRVRSMEEASPRSKRCVERHAESGRAAGRESRDDHYYEVDSPRGEVVRGELPVNGADKLVPRETEAIHERDLRKGPQILIPWETGLRAGLNPQSQHMRLRVEPAEKAGASPDSTFALHNDQLSSEQHAAVNASFSRPLLVFAGPGCGKTRFLAARIARVVEECTSHDMQSIAAVTFTRRAADELAERVRRLTARFHRGDGCRPWVGTLHSLALRILRSADGSGQWGAARVASEGQLRSVAVGLVHRFPAIASLDCLPGDGNCLDDDDAGTAVRDSARRQARDLPSRVLAFLRKAKRNPRRVASMFGAQELAEVQSQYTAALRRLRVLDLDELIPAACRLLESDPAASKWAACHVRHLFVDEWQDTDLEQAALLKILTASSQSITAVGDDDQQIYSWRSEASHHPVEAFFSMWPGASMLKLCVNYRCAPAIVDASTRLVACNKRRVDKKLGSARAGEAGVLFSVTRETPEAEALWLAEQLRHLRTNQLGAAGRGSPTACDSDGIAGCPGGLRADGGSLRSRAAEATGPTGGPPFVGIGGASAAASAALPPRRWGSFAVLARTNATVDHVARTLQRFGIPARRVAHTAGNSAAGAAIGSGRAHPGPVLDVLAYLRLVVDIHHTPSFLRAANTPRRGLGKAAFRHLRDSFGAPPLPREETPLDGLDRLAAAGGDTESAQKSYYTAMRRLLLSPGKLRRLVQGFSTFDRVLRALRASAQSTCSAADICRCVLQSTGLRDQLPTNANDGAALDRLLENAAWYTPGGANGFMDGAACVARFLKDYAAGVFDAEDDDFVSVSTVHAAKGLEWDTVFLVQCNELTFPLCRKDCAVAFAGSAPVAASAAGRDAGALPADGAGGTDSGDAALEEERRLFYVAMTRARSSIVFSGTLRDAEGTPVQASRFLAEAGVLDASLIPAGSAPDARRVPALPPVA